MRISRNLKLYTAVSQ